MTDDRTHRSATGTVLSAAGWLDDHFEACRDAYAAMVDAAGLEPGSSVLDLGAGTGVFMPLLRRAVGPSGRIVAMDLDAQNLRSVRRHDDCTSSVAASALEIPARDDAFDAVWTANLTQYLDDGALQQALAEMVRVVRPGGTVAVKDVDMAAFRFAPAGAFIGAHLSEACATTPPVSAESTGSIRGRNLRTWLLRAGLRDTSLRSFPIEFAGPLEGAALRFWASWLPYLAALAEEKGVPATDLETWRRVATIEAAREFVQRADFHGSELQVVAIGRVP